MSDKLPSSLTPAIYAWQLNNIVLICRFAGYAIAVHGSMNNDFDLVAIPWVKRAVKPSTLVRRLCRELRLKIAEHSPSVKPHGRLAYTLLQNGSS